MARICVEPPYGFPVGWYKKLQDPKNVKGMEAIREKVMSSPTFVRYIERDFEDLKYFDWSIHKYSIPYVVFERCLSLEEMLKCRIFWNVQSSIYARFENSAVFYIYRKILASYWRWGVHQPDYSQFTRTFNLLISFNFAEGFETRINFASWCNEYGWSHFNHLDENGNFDRCQTDGAFLYPIFYQNKHVLTIAVSPSRHGLLLNQVQLKHKKGNRWLFKFPNLLAHVVDKLASLCFLYKIPLLIVDGESKVTGVYKSYGKDYAPSEWSEETQTRIRNFYDQQIPGFIRTTSVEICPDNIRYKFHRLEKA